MSKLRWPPIENNPEVLTDLSHSLGLKLHYAFHDVYSLTDADLLAFIPRPVLAFVLVFPVRGDSSDNEDGASNADTTTDDNVVWLKQTIGNACGTMAILHVLANVSPALIDQDSEFAQLLQSLRATKDVNERVKLIESSTFIREAHGRVATQGQSAGIEAEERVDLHFVAFVKAHTDGRLYELDGSQRPGPIGYGQVEEDDILDAGLDVIRKFIAERSSHGEDLNFSLCALSSGM